MSGRGCTSTATVPSLWATVGVEATTPTRQRLLSAEVKKATTLCGFMGAFAGASVADGEDIPAIQCRRVSNNN